MLQYSDVVHLYLDVVIGFPTGVTVNVTEGVNMAAIVCPHILEGSLEREVSVFATTMDISARGMFVLQVSCLEYIERAYEECLLL